MAELKPKFQEGDKVYIIRDGKPHLIEINDIHSCFTEDFPEVLYDINDDLHDEDGLVNLVKESELFKTEKLANKSINKI